MRLQVETDSAIRLNSHLQRAPKWREALLGLLVCALVGPGQMVAAISPVSAAAAVTQDTDQPLRKITGDGPTKELLLQTLDLVSDALASKQYERAVPYFKVPADFDPRMLSGLTKLQAVSREGVNVLRKSAEFGPAGNYFGKENVANIAARDGFNVADCYGILLIQEGVQAEVVALWVNDHFELQRISGVGKLKPQVKEPIGATESAEMSEGAFPSKVYAQAPSKRAIIGTLEVVSAALEAGQLEAASQHFVLPPNFRPEMLGNLVERNEISAAGVAILKSEAEFQTAVAAFGEERATLFVERAGVELKDCFGFNHTVGEVAAEVIGCWQGDRFKLVRLDDVGKLQPTAASPKNTSPPPRAAREFPRRTAEEAANALGELATAATANPDDIATQIDYAVCLEQVGNLPLAWEVVKKTIVAAPEDPDARRFLLRMMDAWRMRDVLSLNMPQASIQGLLGEPTDTRKIGDNFERWSYGFMAIDFIDQKLAQIVDNRSIADGLFEPLAEVEPAFDGRQWQKIYRNFGGIAMRDLYVPPGEMISSWTETLEISQFTGMAKQLTSLDAIYERVKQATTSQAPAAKVAIVDQSPDSLLMTCEIPAGDQQSDATIEVIRFIKGERDLHRIAYKSKLGEAGKETLQQWSEILGGLQLKKLK